MIESSFLFANITNIMANLTSSIGIPICMNFMKPCWTDIEIIFALQQDVRTHAGNLIYDVRL